MDPESKPVKEAETEVGDVIHHETITVYDWRDRLRILVGRQSRVISLIYTKELVNVVGSEGHAYVDRIIRGRPKTIRLVSPGEGEKKA